MKLLKYHKSDQQHIAQEMRKQKRKKLVKHAPENDLKENSKSREWFGYVKLRQAAGEMKAGRWSLAVNEVDQSAQCCQCQWDQHV